MKQTGMVSCAALLVFSTLAPRSVRAAVSFTEKSITSGVTNGATWLVWGDLNGDGHLDMAAGDHKRSSNLLAWYPGPGFAGRHDLNPAWVQNVAMANCSFGATGDIDGDGRLDLVVPTSASAGAIYWFKNPGGDATATWPYQLVASFPSSSYHFADLMTGDLDKDGKLDIVSRDVGDISATDPKIRIYFQNAPADWQVRTFNTHPREGSVLHDVDADGNLDIAANGFWLRNPGPAGARGGAWTEYRIHSFHYTQTMAATGIRRHNNSSKIAFGDLNKNGRLDAVLSSAEGEPGRIAWYECPADTHITGSNWTEHRLQTPYTDDEWWVGHTLQIGDIDRDGDLDIMSGLYSCYGGVPRIVCVWYNSGDGSSWTRQTVSTQGIYQGILFDAEDDGDLDIMGPWTNSDVSPIYWWRSDLDPGVATAPAVTTRPASSVTATSARLNGEVTSTGGENPTVKICWGDDDGGTGTWDAEEDLGTKGAGTFFKDVSGLTDGTTYYFRCYAENSAGGTWAAASESFTATAPVGGLVGHWEFDDGSGTTATDSSPKGNHGTVNGATWTTGKIGTSALSFGGADTDYVEIPNESDYDLAGAVTYAVWTKAKANSQSWCGVITKGDNMNLQRRGTEDILTWQTKDSPGTISNYQLDAKTGVFDDQWHHVAVTFDGSQKCIYVDGSLDDWVAASGTINTANTPLMIGKNGDVPGHAFGGLIDDVRVYDYALTAGEVKALYDMGSGGAAGPTITQQPQDVTATEGTAATFTVNATGTGTLSYQWHEDGAAISGATGATYTISSTTLAQNGHKFHCVVTDDNGSATSGHATLTVNAPAVDTDGDGLPDDWETRYGLDPTKEDTDGDGTPDPDEDPDGDGRTNLQEYQDNTNPNVSDEPNGDAADGGCTGGGSWAAGYVMGLLLVAICALTSRTPHRGSKALLTCRPKTSNRKMVAATGLEDRPVAPA